MTDIHKDAERGDLEPTLRDPDDSDAKVRAALEKVQQRAQQIRRDARANYRAMEGWQCVRSEEDWLKVWADSEEEYKSGRFFLERLGAERFLDPKLMATLWSLRQRLIAESGITTAAEMMLLDLGLLGYFDALRVHGWIGDSALRIEHEFFGDDAFTEMARERSRRAGRPSVEEQVRRLSEQLLPLLDRANRMLIRNLKAIKELRQGQVPAIAIGRAEQVTVTHRTNVRARLRPVKTERLQALSARVPVLRRAASDTKEGRQDALPTAMTSAPGGGGSPTRRARPGAAAS